MWTETCWSGFYNFNYFNNLRILQFVCISWKIKCLILLMHCATMKLHVSFVSLCLQTISIVHNCCCLLLAHGWQFKFIRICRPWSYLFKLSQIPTPLTWSHDFANKSFISYKSSQDFRANVNEHTFSVTAMLVNVAQALDNFHALNPRTNLSAWWVHFRASQS